MGVGGTRAPLPVWSWAALPTALPPLLSSLSVGKRLEPVIPQLLQGFPNCLLEPQHLQLGLGRHRDTGRMKGEAAGGMGCVGAGPLELYPGSGLSSAL